MDGSIVATAEVIESLVRWTTAETLGKLFLVLGTSNMDPMLWVEEKFNERIAWTGFRVGNPFF